MKQARIMSVLGGIFSLFFLAQAQTEKLSVNFEYVEKLAEKAAQKEYKPVNDESLLPQALHNLSYDQHRNIRFRPDRMIWMDGGLPFRLAMFHLGFLFKTPVELNEFNDNYFQKIRFARELFDYTNSGVDAPLPSDLGFAGFRIHYPLHSAVVFDEIGAFLGASYYRLIGRNQHYGLSSRGLAVNSCLPGTAEEFPVFTHFWISKPKINDTRVLIYALLNSKNVTGAYQFQIEPGNETTATVQATLFFRNKVASIGISPLTSMFWFGEISRKKPDDFRPQVHDSDGLAIKTEAGECLYRPLQSDPVKINAYNFAMPSVKGFGLVQRSRNHQNFLDLEADYERRPSVWVEPIGNWGPGSVRLVELPTDNETNDNIVAFWQPETMPEPGKPFRIAYTQRWTLDGNPAKAAGTVVWTHSGVQTLEPNQPKDVRLIVVEFTGESLSKLPKDQIPEAVVTVAQLDQFEILGTVVQKNQHNGNWRVAFKVNRKEGTTSENPAELRCCLKINENYLTETWSTAINL